MIVKWLQYLLLYMVGSSNQSVPEMVIIYGMDVRPPISITEKGEFLRCTFPIGSV